MLIIWFIYTIFVRLYQMCLQRYILLYYIASIYQLKIVNEYIIYRCSLHFV